jgi:DNA polymerase III epsilon subunit-like protein
MFVRISWKRLARRLFAPPRQGRRHTRRDVTLERNEIAKLRSQLEDHRAILAECRRLWRPAFKRFIAIDVEITGMENATSCIIQMGISEFDRGNFVSLFSIFIDPSVSLGENRDKANQITDWDVRGQGSFRSNAQRIKSLIDSVPLVGHNLDYDIELIENEFRKIGDSINLIPLYCTMKRKWGANFLPERALIGFSMTSSRLPVNDQTWLTLFESAKQHGLLPLGRLHNAAYDAHLAGELFIEMAKRDIKSKKNELDEISINIARLTAKVEFGG